MEGPASCAGGGEELRRAVGSLRDQTAPATWVRMWSDRVQRERSVGQRKRGERKERVGATAVARKEKDGHVLCARSAKDHALF